MANIAPIAAILSGMLLLLVFSPWDGAHSCDICGRECMGSCGDTRTFVTCCYNYLRKRGAAVGAPDPDAPLAAILAAAAADYRRSDSSTNAEQRRPYALRAAPVAPLVPISAYDD